MKTPWPNQVAMANYIYEGGRYPGAEPRVGKTLGSILGLDKLGCLDRTLIVCPVSVQTEWYNELLDRGFEATILEGLPARKNRLLNNSGNHIISWESSWRLDIPLDEYKAVVFDETIKMHNHKRKCGYYWFNQRDKGHLANKVVLGLSGAPCPEGAWQMANPNMVIFGSWMGRKDWFSYMWQNWYVDDITEKYLPVFYTHVGRCNSEFKRLALIQNQKDMGIPDKIFEYKSIPANKAEIKLLAENLKQSKTEQNEVGFAQMASSGLKALGGGILDSPTKLEAVLSYVQDLREVDPKAQVLILYTFDKTGEWLANRLGCSRIHGKDGGRAYRAYKIQRFKQGLDKTIVCQESIVKMGLDFSAADTLIYCEHSWSGDTFIQSVQRTTSMLKKLANLIVTFGLEFGGNKRESVDFRAYQSVMRKYETNSKLMQKV